MRRVLSVLLALTLILSNFMMASLVITALPEGVTFTQVSCGENHTIALASDGTVWAWGRNDNGQLGDGTNIDKEYPVQVLLISDVAQIEAGSDHSLALTESGEVWAWGLNESRRLGDDTSATYRNYPVQVKGILGSGYLTDVEQITAGRLQNLALLSDKKVVSWGGNNYGQLGRSAGNIGNTPDYVTNQSDAPISNVDSIACGNAFSMAIINGEVWSWGHNNYGQLGINSATNIIQYPQKVVSINGSESLTNVADITAGQYHAVALLSSGEVRAWGRNNFGQLGINSNSVDSSNIPVEVISVTGTDNLSGITAIATGENYVLALTGDNNIISWGYNFYGQLGDGSTTGKIRPVEITSLTNATQVSGGGNHSSAIKEGNVYTWGKNDYGQLSNGTSGSQNVTEPTIITGQVVSTETLKVDIGGSGQVPQEDFQAWSETSTFTDQNDLLGTNFEAGLKATASGTSTVFDPSNINWSSLTSMDDVHAQYELLRDSVFNNVGGKIELRLSNLPMGKYELKTYHHNCNNQVSADTELKISVQDVERQGSQIVEESVICTYGSNPSLPGTATIEVYSGGESTEIYIRFQAVQESEIINLNGFELRLVDPTYTYEPANELKVDIGAESQFQQTGYAVMSNDDTTFYELNNVRVRITRENGDSGISLNNSYLQNHDKVNLIRDGAFRNGGIRLRFSNLSQGTYQLITYHHNPDSASQSSMNIYVSDSVRDNQLIASDALVSAGNNNPTIFPATLTLTSDGQNEVFVRFVGSGDIWLNGFELTYGGSTFISQAIKVDMGQDVQELEPGFIDWSVEDGKVFSLNNSITNTTKNVDVKLRTIESQDNLVWSKKNTVSGAYGKLLEDAVESESGIRLLFTGLPAGEYQMTTFHHDASNDPYKSMLLYYVDTNGVENNTGFVDTSQGTSSQNYNSVTFNVESPNNGILIMKLLPVSNGPGVLLNGFELIQLSSTASESFLNVDLGDKALQENYEQWDAQDAKQFEGLGDVSAIIKQLNNVNSVQWNEFSYSLTGDKKDLIEDAATSNNGIVLTLSNLESGIYDVKAYLNEPIMGATVDNNKKVRVKVSDASRSDYLVDTVVLGQLSQGYDVQNAKSVDFAISSQSTSSDTVIVFEGFNSLTVTSSDVWLNGFEITRRPVTVTDFTAEQVGATEGNYAQFVKLSCNVSSRPSLGTTMFEIWHNDIKVGTAMPEFKYVQPVNYNNPGEVLEQPGKLESFYTMPISVLTSTGSKPIVSGTYTAMLRTDTELLTTEFEYVVPGQNTPTPTPSLTPEGTPTATPTPSPLPSPTPKPTPKVKTTNIILVIGEPNMSVNNEIVEIDPGRGTIPVIVDSRTLLPIRAVIEALGGSIGWEDSEKKVSIWMRFSTIEMWINQLEMKVNGRVVTNDVAPIIINARTYVPLRFVAENVGAEVDWDGVIKTVTIEYKEALF